LRGFRPPTARSTGGPPPPTAGSTIYRELRSILCIICRPSLPTVHIDGGGVRSCFILDWFVYFERFDVSIWYYIVYRIRGRLSTAGCRPFFIRFDTINCDGFLGWFTLL
jgi:hypothetical protein